MGVFPLSMKQTSVRRVVSAPCDTLPAPFVTELVVMRLGVQVFDRTAPSYTPAELAALRSVVTYLQRVLPMPEGNPQLKRDVHFTVRDSARKLFMPDFGAGFSFTLRDDGRLIDIDVPCITGGSPSNALMGEAARLAGGSDSLAGIARTLGSRSVRLRVWVGGRRDYDSMATSGAAIAWYESMTPIYRGTPVDILPGTRGPRFPDELRRLGTRGDVVADFLVRRDSVVDKGSIRIVSASDVQFGSAVRAWLSRGRYRPGTVEGCPVSTCVRQPFKFSMGAPGD
ncbi:MAG: energy transducer TonB [Gemmatimonadota bacterium]